MNKKISAFLAIAAIAVSAQAVTVEPTIGAGVAHVTSGGTASLYAEGGLKVSNKQFAGTVGLGSLKTPDHALGTVNYGAVSASYQIADQFAVGAGTYVRVVDGAYTYNPFVQVTGTQGPVDAFIRVSDKKGVNVIQVGLAYKF